MVVNGYEHWPMLLGFANIGEWKVIPSGPSVRIFVSLLLGCGLLAKSALLEEMNYGETGSVFLPSILPFHAPTS